MIRAHKKRFLGVPTRGRTYALTLALVAVFFAICPFVSTTVAKAQPVNRKSLSASTNYAGLVDPFTGTGASPVGPGGWGNGDTFPGADAPFGMVQWSPDTVNAYAGGYDSGDNRIRGFSLTHLSGAGCNGYGDIPFMPYVGAVTNSPASDPSQYVSTFSHSNESAYAGYYKVALDNGVTTELTTTQRTGAARFTYPGGKTATLLVNVSGSINGDSADQVNINGNTISGSATSNGFCGSSASYTVYFYATFNKPFASSGTWQNGTVSPNVKTVKGSSQASPAVKAANTAQAKVFKGHDSSKGTRQQAAAPANTSASGPGAGAYVTFDTSQSTTIEASVGVSYVSTANAQANLSKEQPSTDFNTVLAQSTQTWNKYLGEINVSGGTSAQTATFYSALYHVFLFPSVFSDDNGQYIGFDGKIYTEPSGHAQYANYSGWDIYRSEAQLLGLLAPTQAADMAQSMVNDYAQSGQLPKWSFANTETYVMVGDPADAIIADFYAFGGTGFDTQSALNAMVKEATQTNNIRPGLNYLENIGYLPSDGSYGCCNYYGDASTTLEYNSADFAIGAFAGAIGNSTVHNQFVDRAQDWENLLNTNDGYLEPRSQNTSFPSSYDPTSGNDWVEGDGAQYNWLVLVVCLRRPGHVPRNPWHREPGAHQPAVPQHHADATEWTDYSDQCPWCLGLDLLYTEFECQRQRHAESLVARVIHHAERDAQLHAFKQRQHKLGFRTLQRTTILRQCEWRERHLLDRLRKWQPATELGQQCRRSNVSRRKYQQRDQHLLWTQRTRIGHSQHRRCQRHRVRAQWELRADVFRLCPGWVSELRLYATFRSEWTKRHRWVQHDAFVLDLSTKFGH